MRDMPFQTLEWWKNVALGLQTEMVSRGLVLEAIKLACVEGLTTDGAHHKQWYLDQILRLAATTQEYAELKDESDWNEGIAP